MHNCSLMICRYSCVDVPFQIALQTEFDKGLSRVVMMYDIACKYNINAYARCVENPHSLLDQKYWIRIVRGNGWVEYYVNGFHIQSHRPECADNYGASFAPLMAIRIAEEVEGHHKKGNRNQWSTREMDAGARQDTITVHMLNSNADKFNKMRECND